jgi:serine/threonine-protein kinase
LELMPVRRDRSDVPLLEAAPAADLEDGTTVAEPPVPATLDPPRAVTAMGSEPWTEPVRSAPALGELGPGARVGDYVLEERVGEGAMGIVYRAVHSVLGNKAAIKIMRPIISSSPEGIERFVKEARMIAQLDHPNIVHAFAFGRLTYGR